MGANAILAEFVFSETHLGNIGSGLGVRNFTGVSLERILKKGLNLPVNVLVGGEGFLATKADDASENSTYWGGLGIRLDFRSKILIDFKKKCKKAAYAAFFYFESFLLSIIIPIYNEVDHIPRLMRDIKKYKDLGHELIIIDDGSNDGSSILLDNAKFIKLIKFKRNRGKGEALKIGLLNTINENIIIFDGDLELDPYDIEKLMVLSPKKGIYCAFANRGGIQKINSIWSLGNVFLSFLFNLKNNSNVKDSLCCAKSFFKIRYQHTKS